MAHYDTGDLLPAITSEDSPEMPETEQPITEKMRAAVLSSFYKTLVADFGSDLLKEKKSDMSHKPGMDARKLLKTMFSDEEVERIIRIVSREDIKDFARVMLCEHITYFDNESNFWAMMAGFPTTRRVLRDNMSQYLLDVAKSAIGLSNDEPTHTEFFLLVAMALIEKSRAALLEAGMHQESEARKFYYLSRDLLLYGATHLNDEVNRDYTAKTFLHPEGGGRPRLSELQRQPFKTDKTTEVGGKLLNGKEVGDLITTASFAGLADIANSLLGAAKPKNTMEQYLVTLTMENISEIKKKVAEQHIDVSGKEEGYSSGVINGEMLFESKEEHMKEHKSLRDLLVHLGSGAELSQDEKEFIRSVFEFGQERERRYNEPYVNEFLDLNVKYEELESAVYTGFLKRHGKELTTDQTDLIKQMIAEHMSYVEDMDRKQEDALDRKGLNDLDSVAKTFNSAGNLLIEHDKFFYKEAKEALDGPLKAAFEREVEPWLKTGSDRYVAEYAALNARFGLSGLNEKLGISAPTSSKSRSSG
ncbi:MAG: hypothetical protein LVQ95_00505 [Candidatus Micrarchaeales archaeon]|nr:hypothetical protein [Candidatus Micrarchaeales archaeon]